ncbi:uncharacterized protein LAESUDRAFT_392323 [Laetiporus sulphureus 93-53]|uniref:Uncharacterized protein n=1 Tax=Laetiporus sulphureus 93-53 TaxID=1314785 RepID=A0A165CHT2_9APHY|nr:uncharacterized protein LAESUDRAFT_392323 [Laetiporus sulphureus 93-53]KZT02841.1 hypothetical protein LAESUDRAFT_392323 [Laetiporus sulphureus 93-53]
MMQAQGSPQMVPPQRQGSPLQRQGSPGLGQVQGNLRKEMIAGEQQNGGGIPASLSRNGSAHNSPLRATIHSLDGGEQMREEGRGSLPSMPPAAVMFDDARAGTPPMVGVPSPEEANVHAHKPSRAYGGPPLSPSAYAYGPALTHPVPSHASPRTAHPVPSPPQSQEGPPISPSSHAHSSSGHGSNHNANAGKAAHGRTRSGSSISPARPGFAQQQQLPTPTPSSSASNVSMSMSVPVRAGSLSGMSGLSGLSGSMDKPLPEGPRQRKKYSLLSAFGVPLDKERMRREGKASMKSDKSAMEVVQVQVGV